MFVCVDEQGVHQHSNLPDRMQGTFSRLFLRMLNVSKNDVVGGANISMLHKIKEGLCCRTL